ncbi:MAG: DNA mismatch repair protein MutS [Piscirickettsiaceae bacterium]|nr:MAG: DNA mismatch repair protein MutS [Piscirickettsiaceae bacterium]
MTEDKLKHLTSNEDSQLFRESVGTINKIKNDNRLLATQKAKSSTKTSANKPSRSMLFDIKYEQFVEGSESIYFVREGINGKTARQLKRGDIHVSDCLDLHGLIEKDAQQAILNFIQKHHALSHRYVMIIHGKGLGGDSQYPVLKNLTINLLTAQDNVLAFTSALASDGGTGALYVLLKK